MDKVQRIRDYWAEAVKTGNRDATKHATHRARPIGLALAVSALGLVSAQAVESAAPKAEAPRAEAPPPAPTPPGETKPTTCDAGCVRSSFSAAREKLFSVATVRKTCSE